jgi:hypothetical protein
MIRLSLIAYLLTIMTPLLAQTQKGGWLVGANVASAGFVAGKQEALVNSPGPDNSNSFNISATPSALFFVINNLAIGASINVGYERTKTTANFSTTAGVYQELIRSHSIAFNPEIRKYFGRSGAKGQPWINAFGGFVTNPKKVEWSYPYYGSGKSTNHYHGWDLGGGIGYAHFFKERIALQYYVNYQYTYLRTKIDQNAPYSNEATNTLRNGAINFGVGLQVLLKRKHA